MEEVTWLAQEHIHTCWDGVAVIYAMGYMVEVVVGNIFGVRDVGTLFFWCMALQQKRYVECGDVLPLRAHAMSVCMCVPTAVLMDVKCTKRAVAGRREMGVDWWHSTSCTYLWRQAKATSTLFLVSHFGVIRCIGCKLCI